MYNKAILVGRLTADPELKQTLNGVSVCSFSIACDRAFSGRNGERQTDFINIVCWRQTAEFVARYFTKGKPILICGSLQTRSWVDKDVNKRYTTEVVADEATFVERKSDSTDGSRDARTIPQQGGIPAYGTPKVDDSFEELSADDELPF